MKLFIENLNSCTTEEDLACLFGNLKGFINLIINKDHFGLSARNGYLHFESIKDGQNAIAMYNGYQLMGKLIKITQTKGDSSLNLRNQFWR